MNNLRQVFFGVLAALLSVAIVFGSFTLALTEVVERVALLPSPLPTGTQAPTLSPGLAVPPTFTIEATLPESPQPGTPAMVVSPTLTGSPTPAPSPTGTGTVSPPPTNCPLPDGWMIITIQAGDTLASLAKQYTATEDALAQANCLITVSLIPGTLLYVPGQAPTPPPPQCGAPRGWVLYTVQPDDNLYRLGLELDVSVSQLQYANCLGSSTLIRIGQKLYLPRIPSRTPVPPPPTPTQEASPTSEPTIETPIPSPPVETPTPVPDPTEAPPDPTEPGDPPTPGPTPEPPPEEPDGTPPPR